jgi:uncharacterized protein
MQDTCSRRDFVKTGLGMALLAAQPAPAKPSLAKSLLEPFNYTGVRLKDGMLRSQFLYARNLYMNIPDDSFLLGFRKRAGLPAPGKPLVGWYDGDPSRRDRFAVGDVYNTFGQYLSGMARIAKANEDAGLRDKANHLMDEWAKTIEPDGYFYYSRHPHTPHYIYEKMTCGLVDLYEYGGARNAMSHLERITDWAARNLDRSRRTPLDGCNRSADGQEWYTLCENVYRAYQLSGDERFKTFGDLWRYPAYWGIFDGKSDLQPWGFHAYSNVNTLSSAAMTYAVTGDPQYLRTIVKAFDWLEQTQLFATGGFGPGENIMRPDGSLGKSLETNNETFETVCGSWACFKLSRYLMMFTGEAKYGDWIERLVYNGIGAALPIQPDGTNFYYSDYQLGGGRKIYHPQWKWSCCSGTYPQAIADYHNIIYFRDAEGLYVNLYVPSELDWAHNGEAVRVVQETSYPESETTTLTIQPPRPTEFALRFRVPHWCEGATASVNGTPQQIACKPRTWGSIRRTWQPGDRVALRFPMRLVFAPVDKQHPNRVALTYGPVVLVRKDNWLLVPGKGDLPDWIVRDGEGLQFRMKSRRSQPGPFVPFYELGRNEPYHMYFDLQV